MINTSGAGALIIDADAARAWTGFYVSARSRESADLETADGRAWRMRDVDLKHPVTAYDRLCRLHARHDEAGVLVAKIGRRSFASISDGSDAFAWWPALGIFTANASRRPARKNVARATFTRVGTIDVPSGSVLLMNPCDHGAALAPEDVVRVALKPGKYLVEVRARPASADNVLLLRLTSAGRRAQRAS